MLAKPSEHLKNYRVKLQPMLGCVGVAPPNKQAFQAGWLGSLGRQHRLQRPSGGHNRLSPGFLTGRDLVRR